MDHQETLSDLVGRVVDDAKAVAEAELAVAKERARIEARRFGIAAALFVGAAVLALAAIVALLVGLILTLLPRVGPGPATTIVVIGTLVIAAILGWAGSNRINAR